jgi:hypothetical protein
MVQKIAEIKIHKKILDKFLYLEKQILIALDAAKHRSYQKQQAAKRIQKCCQEVEQAVCSLYKAGEYPSEARVSQLISQPGYFRYKKVRRYLN